MIFTNDLSPILFYAGPIEIRWYGLLFALGIAFNYLFLVWIFKKRRHSFADLDSLVIYLFLGLLIGARLGHVLFYNAEYFFSNPLEILKVWNGGLASHGAAIGLLIAYLIWIKIRKVSFYKYADLLILPMPITAAFVRIGNFFNSEIVGKATQSDWGVVFKRLGEDFPRHPVQFYEADVSIVIFIVMFLIYKKYYEKTKPLFFMFLYMLLYFAGRFVVEFWKDQEGITPDSLMEKTGLSTGQLLSILPLLAAVVYFIFFYRKLAKR